MAKGDGVYAGKMNTAIIVAGQGYGDGNTYAADICANCGEEYVSDEVNHQLLLKANDALQRNVSLEFAA